MYKDKRVSNDDDHTAIIFDCLKKCDRHNSCETETLSVHCESICDCGNV